MDGAWLEKQDEFDGSINCKQLIDGLLMKKGVSQKQKQVVDSVEPAPADGRPRDRGLVLRNHRGIAVPDVLIGPRFLLP